MKALVEHPPEFSSMDSARENIASYKLLEIVSIFDLWRNDKFYQKVKHHSTEKRYNSCEIK